MIKPTVGRMVWFYPKGSNPSDQPHAALIAHVWAEPEDVCQCGDPLMDHCGPGGSCFIERTQ